MKALVLVLALATATAVSPYTQEINKWRSDRATRLKADDGWLTLVGLSWIHDGANDVKLPSTPAATVHVVLQNGKATLSPLKGMTIDGKLLAAAVALRDDTDTAGPTVVHYGTLAFHVIKRNDKYGLRIKDTKSPARVHFKGLHYFPADPKYRVEARFEPYNPPKKIAITNVLGMTGDEVSPGALVFSLGGKTYRIDPILEQGEKDLFIIFKDQTSGRETYGAARYLYAAPPGADGKTIIDFNKAYNPPCAFTSFATCPLPPPQNRLALRITAGEKKYGNH